MLSRDRVLGAPVRAEIRSSWRNIKWQGQIPQIETRNITLGVRMVDRLCILRSLLGLVLSQKHRDALLR